MVWAPPTLDVPHAELTVDQIAGLVKDLNLTQRFAGLSLGGNEGAMTAGAVSTWQSGFPLRVCYASGAPEFDPYRYAIFRMLTEGEGDLLVWIASISPDLAPPATDMPTIVLGTPGLKLPQAAGGVHSGRHAGRRPRRPARPLRQRRVAAPEESARAELPRAADVLAAIEAAL